MKNFTSIHYFLSVFRWELKFHLKSISLIVFLFSFAISLVVIYNYALSNDVFFEKRNYWGLLLLTVYFMVILLSGKSLQREKEGGAYKIILMSPVPRYYYYLAKVAVKSMVIFLILVIYSFFYEILLTGQLELYKNKFYGILVLFPYVIALVAVGEIVSLLSSGNRMKELVMPLIFFPLTIPVYIIYTNLVAMVAREEHYSSGYPLKFFIFPVAVDIIYVLIGILFFSFLSVEEA